MAKAKEKGKEEELVGPFWDPNYPICREMQKKCKSFGGETEQ